MLSSKPHFITQVMTVNEASIADVIWLVKQLNFLKIVLQRKMTSVLASEVYLLAYKALPVTCSTN